MTIFNPFVRRRTNTRVCSPALRIKKLRLVNGLASRLLFFTLLGASKKRKDDPSLFRKNPTTASICAAHLVKLRPWMLTPRKPGHATSPTQPEAESGQDL